jgi:V/A-type H+-transporting ATPase subunit G/H
MKIEVLKSIKQSEETYKETISQANADRERRISAARMEADNMVIAASASTEEYKKKLLSDAREEAARKREEIIRKGDERAAALRARGKKNLEKAVALLISRFREQLHVTA